MIKSLEKIKGAHDNRSAPIFLKFHLAFDRRAGTGSDELHLFLYREPNSNLHPQINRQPLI